MADIIINNKTWELVSQLIPKDEELQKCKTLMSIADLTCSAMNAMRVLDSYASAKVQAEKAAKRLVEILNKETSVGQYRSVVNRKLYWHQLVETVDKYFPELGLKGSVERFETMKVDD